RDSGDDADEGGHFVDTPDSEGEFAEDDTGRQGLEGDADADSIDSPSGGFFAPQEEPDPERLEDNTFEDYGVRPFVDASMDNLSTFALDVDTGSYTVTRRWLDEGVLPDPDSVRVEEFVNAFDYDYDAPRSGLALHVDGAPSPYDEGNVIVRVGVQAAIIDDRDRPAATLTFVVDTSGSMDRDDRLGLVKEALVGLVRELDDDDTVAIVTYGDSSAIVLEPTRVRHQDEIIDAIDDLRPGGSTNLEAGLRTGYELAEEAFSEGGINRVILASDGVANVGTTDPDRLSADISSRAINGIQLVTVGFGMGNFNDETMEQLADQGDGFYAYVDSRDEAERLFEEELIATLVPVAIDARIQVEFDDDLVDAYRLIGFENRGVLDSDFRNEDVDAGELSSGHTVTALYELDLDRNVRDSDELGVVTVAWIDPDDGDWVEADTDIDMRDISDDWGDAEFGLRLAATVAAWAEILRHSPHVDNIDIDIVAEEAEILDDERRSEQTEELADLTDQTARLW
ncbi:MAG: DUF3520 domain-containing protein, partial [Actinomycetia bacterium]|nr:DUF3520 domain-containing protein [Actinomycetes bacterium]